jgi:hypothetical protein
LTFTLFTFEATDVNAVSDMSFFLFLFLVEK